MNIQYLKDKNKHFGELQLDNQFSWQFLLKNVSMRNSRNELFKFMTECGNAFPEYQQWLQYCCELINLQNWDALMEALKGVRKFSKLFIDALGIDIDSYCDEKKKTKRSMFITKEEMTTLIYTIGSLKLAAPFIFDKSLYTDEIYKKVIYTVAEPLYENGFVDALYKIIRQTSFRFSLTDKHIWYLISIKYGHQNIGYSLMMFNCFLHQFLITYNFDQKKNPMTYIISVVNSSFDWLIKMSFNDVTVITEDNEVYFEQQLMSLDIDKMIMNESLFNNHILLGLKYLFTREDIDSLVHRSNDATISPIMYTIGNLLTSKITGISSKFLNERKSSYIILNNIFISQLISKLFPNDPYYQQLALLLRVVRCKKMVSSTRCQTPIIKKYFDEIMKSDVKFYGISDKSILINIINYIVQGLKVPLVYDIVKGTTIRLPDDWITTVIQTFEKLFNENNKDFDKLRTFFHNMISFDQIGELKQEEQT